MAATYQRNQNHFSQHPFQQVIGWTFPHEPLIDLDGALHCPTVIDNTFVYAGDFREAPLGRCYRCGGFYTQLP